MSRSPHTGAVLGKFYRRASFFPSPGMTIAFWVPVMQELPSNNPDVQVVSATSAGATLRAFAPDLGIETLVSDLSDKSIPNLDLFYNLDMLFSQIAHEGRNHMSPIMGYASMIRDASETETNTHNYANKILGGVGLLENYLDQLEMYRLKSVALVSKTSWRSFVDEILEGFSKINRTSAPIRLENEIQGTVTLRTELVKRMILHLLRNACEACSRSGCITLNARLLDTPEPTGRQKIQLRISDEGCGIAQSKLDHIWQPFFTTKPNHFGLGLAYVSMAASMIGATMCVESTENNGTVFFIELQPIGGNLEST